MSTRVFVVSENNVSTYAPDIILWYYVNAPQSYESLYIGDIIIGKTGPEYNKTIENIRNNKSLEKFSKILKGLPRIPTYGKQLDELLEEIIIIEKLGIMLEEDLNIIKTGIKIAKEKNLYLRFEGN